MSAIYGILGDADLSELQLMGSRLAHRGAASREWSILSTVYFGARCRLHGAVSLPAPDLPIAFSGFIDNRDVIVAMLNRDASIDPGSSNEELVFALYRQMGPDGFRFLSGQFAVAIWDERKEKLVLARDAWSTHPFFVTQADGRYLFATEYKALLAIDSVIAEPNRDALQHIHCTKYVQADACCLSEVYPVPGGGWLELFPDQKKEQYRYQELTIKIPQRSDGEHAQALRESFLKAVQRQIKPCDSIGVALSGGLDSAVTVGAVKHISPDKTLHTFTTGFGPDDGDITEAEVVARHFGTVHHNVYLSSSDLGQLMPRVLWHMEDPIGREEKVFYYITALEARKHVKLILTGHNADALFAGMPRHRVVKMAAMAPFAAGPLQEFYQYTQTGRPADSILGRVLVAAYFRGKHVAPPRIIGASGLPSGKGFPLENQQPISELLRHAMLHDPNANSAIERIHGAFGIAFNSPFLDSDLVQSTFEIPDSLKIRGFQQKYILRKACTGLLPDHILNRKKGLLRLRHDRHFCDVLDGMADDLLSPHVVNDRGIFEQRYVDKIRQRPGNGVYAIDKIYRLWSLLLTEMWARMFLDNRGMLPDWSGG